MKVGVAGAAKNKGVRRGSASGVKPNERERSGAGTGTAGHRAKAD